MAFEHDVFEESLADILSHAAMDVTQGQARIGQTAVIVNQGGAVDGRQVVRREFIFPRRHAASWFCKLAMKRFPATEHRSAEPTGNEVCERPGATPRGRSIPAAG
jgi:hypothetical protein